MWNIVLVETDALDTSTTYINITVLYVLHVPTLVFFSALYGLVDHSDEWRRLVMIYIIVVMEIIILLGHE